MEFIGIDVGVNGGIAVLKDDRKLDVFTIPKIKDTIDYTMLHHIIDDFSRPCFVCIEDVHSIFGSSAKSNFNFGKIAGVLLGMVVASNYAYELVQPKIWQKEIWTNNDIVKKPNGKNDTKATSLIAAKRIFPGETFVATPRSKKPHDGLYDAALIAEYCRRLYG